MLQLTLARPFGLGAKHFSLVTVDSKGLLQDGQSTLAVKIGTMAQLGTSKQKQTVS
jgi:hypothetical protein